MVRKYGWVVIAFLVCVWDFFAVLGASNGDYLLSISAIVWGVILGVELGGLWDNQEKRGETK